MSVLDVKIRKILSTCEGVKGVLGTEDKSKGEENEKSVSQTVETPQEAETPKDCFGLGVDG